MPVPWRGPDRRSKALGLGLVLTLGHAAILSGDAEAATAESIYSGTGQPEISVSPAGTWSAIASVSGPPMFKRSNGATWEDIGAPPIPQIDAYGVSDTGTVYAVYADTVSNPTYPPTRFYRYAGSWSAPVTIPQSTISTYGGTAALVVTDSMLVAIQKSWGRFHYSVDDGATWTETAGVGASGFTSAVATVVAGDFVHVIKMSGVFHWRWHIPTRTLSTQTLIGSNIGGVSISASPMSPDKLWIAGKAAGGGLFLSGSADHGLTWTKVLENQPYPTSLGSALEEVGTKVVMGGDGRLHAFGTSYNANDVTLKEASHGLDDALDWSAPTTLATLPTTAGAGVSVLVPLRAGASYPSAPEVYVRLPSGGSTTSLYRVVGLGSAGPAPATPVRTRVNALVAPAMDASITPETATSPNGSWRVLRARKAGKAVLFRSNNMEQWEEIGSPAMIIHAVAIGDSGGVFAVGDWTNSSAYGLYWYSAGWYGPLWFKPTPDNFPKENVGALAFDGTTLMSVTEPNGRVAYSADFGESWAYSTSIGTGMVNNVVRATPVAGMLHLLTQASSGASVYRRWDMGTKTFATVTTPPTLANQDGVMDLWSRGGSEVFIAQHETADTLRLIRSPDNGATWSTGASGEAFPAGFADPIAMTMGSDLRLHVYATRLVGTSIWLRHVSRSLTLLVDDWTSSEVLLSAPTTFGDYIASSDARGDGSPASRSRDIWFMPDREVLGAVKRDIYWVGDTLTLGGARGRGCSSSVHATNPTACQADPVSSSTGAYESQTKDLSYTGIGVPFDFARTYNSQVTTSQGLGEGWGHSLGAYLTFETNGNITLHGEDHQVVEYILRADESFDALGASSRLSVIAGAFQLVRRDAVVYRFDSAGKLMSLLDRNGKGLTITRAGTAISSVTDAAGRTFTFTYDAAGVLAGITGPDGRVVGYGYTGIRLTSVTDLRGGTIRYTYNAVGRLEKVIDQNGHTVVENAYGPDGRIASQLDALGHLSTFSWDATAQTSTMTDALGGQWKDIYASGVLMAQKDPLGNTSTYGYDENLNRTSVRDPRGNVWQTLTDASGNVVERSFPSPFTHVETFSYNSKNDVTSFKNGRGKTTSHSYDASGNRTIETRPGGVITTFTRDPAGTGWITKITDPRGKQTKLAYNANGDLVRTETPTGAVTTFAFDGAGRVIEEVTPRGNVAGGTAADYRWTFAYDSAGNLLTRTDPLGNVTTSTFDAAGNRTTSRDGRGNVTRFGYDDANHLTRVEAPLSTAVTTYGYDNAGNLTSRTDAKGHVTTYGYDSAHRLASISGPGGRWDYVLDPNGNRTRVVTPAGTATPGISTDGLIDAAYDELNRPVGRAYSDGSPSVTWGYDATGNRSSMNDALGVETRVYDDLDRLTRVTRGGIDRFVYVYDAAGNILSRTARGYATSFIYDDDARLTRATGAGASLQYGYDADGQVISRNDVNGLAPNETRTYDRAGRLSSVGSAKAGLTLASTTVLRDAVGNPIRSTDQLGQVTTYTYDPMDRLSEVCFAASCALPIDPFVRWAYDDVGNRTQETRPTGATAYSYDAADRLASATTLTGTTTYGYDANGNRNSAGSWTYAYDVAGRMTSAGDGSDSVAYACDGDGMRASATATTSEGTSVVRTLWDANSLVPQIAEERDAADEVLRRYVYGLDRSAMVNPEASHFYLHDTLGSVVGLASSAGAIEASYSYEPYGVPRATSIGEPTGIVNPMRFAGERQDENTGLYHLRARQYDAGTGTFMQVDPVRPAIEDPYVASYVYANDRPTFLVDPLGLFGWGSFFRTAGFIAAGVALAAVLPAGLGSVAAARLILAAAAVGVAADVGGAVVACQHGRDSACMSAIGWVGFDVVTLGLGFALTGTATKVFGGVTAGSGVLRK